MLCRPESRFSSLGYNPTVETNPIVGLNTSIKVDPLLLAFEVANLGDYISTKDALKRGAIELNPFLGKHPSNSSLAIFTILVAVGVPLLVDHYPENRTETLSIFTGGKVLAILNNTGTLLLTK